MLNYIRSIVVYHLQKKYKKRFFVNNQKYLLYFVLLGIFYTLSNSTITATSTTQPPLKKSSVTENTTPQKKQKLRQNKKNKPSSFVKISANNQHRSKKSTSKKNKKTSEQAQPIIEKSKCPHAGIPLEYLNSAELEEVLVCAQAQKDNLDNQLEKLEDLIEKVEKQEELDPAKKQKTGLINLIAQAPRCPYSNTPLKKLKAEHLEEVYAYTQTHKMDAAFMIELLERLIALSDNHAGVKKYKLQLADTHYKVHHIEKAAACYEDFAVLYPGSNENEYVLYKAVMCMFELSLDADRDQTNTKKTITLIKEFLKHAKKSELIEEAQTMLQRCYDRLYDHEVYVFNFYTKKKNFTAAQMRLDYLAKTFTETIKDLDKKVVDLTAQLELAKNPIQASKSSIVKKLLA